MAKQSSFPRNSHGNPASKPFPAKPFPQPKVTGLPAGFKQTASGNANTKGGTGAVFTTYTNVGDKVKVNKFNV